jgi:hypothetical protein
VASAARFTCIANSWLLHLALTWSMSTGTASTTDGRIFGCARAHRAPPADARVARRLGIAVSTVMGGAFRAQMTVGGKLRSLGQFATADAAAVEYDRAALEIFGSFARLNFPGVRP